MKVLIINTVDTARNGITNVIFNHLKELKGSGIVFDMVVKNELDSGYSNLIEGNGGQYYFIPRSLRTFANYINSLRKLIKRNSYDVVHIHGNSHTLVIELLAAKLGGCKIRIVHAHNTSCNCVWLHKILSGVFHSMCTHRLACGIDAGRFMYGNRSFEVLRNGIDINTYSFDNIIRQSVRKQYGMEEIVLLGHIGGFNEAKNQSFLLDILNELLRGDSRCRLLLIGDGPFMNQVKEKAMKLNIDEQIIFLGETDDVSAYLSAMDLFLMPSLHEGLPLAMIEAQANGLNCIASDRITKEVNQTGNVQFLPIDKGTSPWSKAITEFNFKGDRMDKSKKAIDCIVKQGYSIQGEAERLRMYYQKVIHS